MTRFRLCQSCSRHVLVSERACPFCQQALEPAPERPIARFAPGLSRAQRLAIAAAAVTGQALAACTSEVNEPIYGAPVPTQHGGNGGSGGTATGTGGQVAVPLYGAPVAGHVAANGGSGGSGGGAGIVAIPPYGISPVPAYGAPVAGHPSEPEDAGVVEDASTPVDAGHMFHPLYGAPAPVYGAPIAGSPARKP